MWPSHLHWRSPWMSERRHRPCSALAHVPPAPRCPHLPLSFSSNPYTHPLPTHPIPSHPIPPRPPPHPALSLRRIEAPPSPHVCSRSRDSITSAHPSFQKWRISSLRRREPTDITHSPLRLLDAECGLTRESYDSRSLRVMLTSEPSSNSRWGVFSCACASSMAANSHMHSIAVHLSQHPNAWQRIHLHPPCI